MKTMRPYQFFDLLPSTGEDRLVQTAIPSGRKAGGVTTLETMLLLAGVKLVDARRIFEFGTFRGFTTLNLAASSGDDAEVFTFDLDNTEITRGTEDRELAEIHLANKPAFETTRFNTKVTRLTGNSRTFDFSPWKGLVDFIFIDGGHDLETVAADTQNALSMLSASGCIFWHDFEEPNTPDVTNFLKRLSAELELTHIEDTHLCVHLNGAR